MNKVCMCVMTFGVLLSGKAVHAEEKPLDLTIRGITLRPQLMLDRKEEMRPEDRTLPFVDAKTHAIIIPSLQMKSGETTVTFGFRPRSGGGQFRMRVTFP